jgi:segregation and condensation protein B
VSDSASDTNLAGALEALLFVTDEPVSVLKLSAALGQSAAAVQDALEALSGRLELEGRGIQLREVAGGWRLFTHPAYDEVVKAYVLSWDTRKLSAAAMETLACVAYAQPVTRAGLAQLRGVSSDSPLASLCDKGFVTDIGTSDAPGNPTLYGTTKLFLEKFGLRTLADLPPLDDFAPDAETRQMIAERLSATRQDTQVSEQGALLAAQEYMAQNAEGVTGKSYAESADVNGEGGEEAGEAQPGADAMKQAVASALGLVEKINFDELTFDFDNE